MIVDKELDEIELERKNRQAKDDGATTEGVEIPKGEIEPIEDGAMQLSGFFPVPSGIKSCLNVQTYD